MKNNAYIIEYLEDGEWGPHSLLLATPSELQPLMDGLNQTLAEKVHEVRWRRIKSPREFERYDRQGCKTRWKEHREVEWMSIEKVCAYIIEQGEGWEPVLVVVTFPDELQNMMTDLAEKYGEAKHIVRYRRLHSFDDIADLNAMGVEIYGRNYPFPYPINWG
jgi:hypothetical protein